MTSQPIKVPYETLVCENLSYKEGCEILAELQTRFNDNFDNNYIFILSNQPDSDLYKISVQYKSIRKDFIQNPELFYLKRET